MPPELTNRFPIGLLRHHAKPCCRHTATQKIYGTLDGRMVDAAFAEAGVTRHTVLPTSSATSSAPALLTATPTGRPSALPSWSTKPVRTSIGAPDGRPLVN